MSKHSEAAAVTELAKVITLSAGEQEARRYMLPTRKGLGLVQVWRTHVEPLADGAGVAEQPNA